MSLLVVRSRYSKKLHIHQNNALIFFAFILLIQVDIPVSSTDAYPPGTVTDLAVSIIGQSAVNGMNITIQLKWTAPGDELDTGTGSEENCFKNI